MFRSILAKIYRAPQQASIALIKAYRFSISPIFGPRCRFYPSCSVYAIEAIEQHGFVRGVWLAIKRVLKCHPLHSGGCDCVPERKPKVQKKVPICDSNNKIYNSLNVE